MKDPRRIQEILFAVVGFFCIYILNDISSNMDKLTDSVTTLNVKIAKILEAQKLYEFRLQRLEKGKEE